jgi:uncharacterized membrane protein
MKIKTHTIIKGLVWELLGVIILSTYMVITTGSWHAALSVGLGYPALRSLMWYPYERVFKWVRRRKYGLTNRTTCHC